MAGRRNRRRTYLVNRKLQLGIALRIVLYLACYLALFSGVALVTPFVVLVSGSASEEAALAAAGEVIIFFENLARPALLTFACLTLHCILLSHRIAGPAYRFLKVFEAAQDGDISDGVQLRKGDYFTDLAAAYNRMMGTLGADVAFVRDEIQTLVEDARRVAENGATGVNPLVERGERILDRLERFVVDGDVQTAREAAPAEPAGSLRAAT